MPLICTARTEQQCRGEGVLGPYHGVRSSHERRKFKTDTFSSALLIFSLSHTEAEPHHFDTEREHNSPHPTPPHPSPPSGWSVSKALSNNGVVSVDRTPPVPYTPLPPPPPRCHSRAPATPSQPPRLPASRRHHAAHSKTNVSAFLTHTW